MKISSSGMNLRHMEKSLWRPRRKRRHEGQCPGRDPGAEPDGGCDLRLRTDPDAARHQGDAAEKGIKCYISLEEKMACGIGACLACVCQSKDVDHHSNVHNKRICKDGPVFLAEEVEL